MATSVAPLARDARYLQRTTRISWTIWAGVIAVTLSSVGFEWDVSWHRSIGRDGLLSAPHLMIYACGIIGALICGYLIFYTTFGRSQALKGESVSVLGFRAPLGAFIVAWGGLAMLASAPFDNWWHNAYGLDTKTFSPPHTLLVVGFRVMSVGIIFLILAARNRSVALLIEGGVSKQAEANYRKLQALFLYMAGMTVLGQMLYIQAVTWDVFLHGTTPYVALAIAVPIAFAMLWRASGSRWACTISAAIYMAVKIGEILILPLFPASPKLGPVYFQVTHFVPADFPLLIIVPAIALDLLWQRIGGWKAWQIALISGVTFVAIMFVVEWKFASFLMSKAAENRFFGTIYFDYNARAYGHQRMRTFFEQASGMRLLMALAWAWAIATVGTWLGLLFGQWMRGVKR